MATPSPRKRSYAEADLDILAGLEEVVKKELPFEPNTPQKKPHSPQSSGSSKRSHERARDVSPAPSSSTLSTLSASPAKYPVNNPPNGNPPKRQKLSFAEKEAQRLQREEDKRQKAEIKARKEEEKQMRDRERAEEKTQKEEKRLAMLVEKEEKRKMKEEQDRAREEEKRLKEEEKNRKERSQLKLNAFFKQPTLTQQETKGSPGRDITSPLGSRRGSISSVHCPEAASRDHERLFPAFFLHPHTALAPLNRFHRDEEGLDHARSKLDSSLEPIKIEVDVDVDVEVKVESEEPNIEHLAPKSADLLHIRLKQRRHSRQSSYTVKDIVAQIQGTAYSPVDLTTSTSQRLKAIQTSLELLKSIPMKSLKFVEDVRPPYIGTYTKLPLGVTAAKLGRKPFGRTVPSLDYDYDSEAEWEAPGEGEDLDSEGEDDLEEDEDEDDMNDFVVDEGGAEVKKRTPININAEHTSTGLCWENANGKSKTAIDNVEPMIDMNQYKMEMIHDDPKFPIDPYSTQYWVIETEVQPTHPSTATAMDPPRVPLTAVNRENQQLPYPAFGNTIGLKATGGSNKSANHRAVKPVTVKKFIPSELFDEFKKAVAGSDSTKLGIVEELKKKFPKQSKGAISDTLTTMADRTGPREGDKRWVIKAEFRTSAA